MGVAAKTVRCDCVPRATGDEWAELIPEPPARAPRNRRHRRAPLWAPEAVGHVTRRGRGEVGRLRGRER